MPVEGLELETCSRSRAVESCGRSLAMPRMVTHGWSGHVRFNVPDVPGLRDHSAVVICDLDELDSAIVIYLCNPHGIQVWIWAMLAPCASFDYYHIAYVLRMWLSFSIFLACCFEWQAAAFVLEWIANLLGKRHSTLCHSQTLTV